VASRRAKWVFTAFVWVVTVAVIVAQAAGWIAPRAQAWQFATVALTLAAAATLGAWLSG
jgi:hypothetical protein